MRYHYTFPKIVKNTHNAKCWWSHRKMGTLIHCWWDCTATHALWKAVWQLIKNLNTQLPHDPAISFLVFTQQKQRHVYTKTCTLMSMAASFIITRIWKQFKSSSTGKWETNLGPSNKGILLRKKKEKLLMYATAWLDLKSTVLSEGSQAPRFWPLIALTWLSGADSNIVLGSDWESPGSGDEGRMWPCRGPWGRFLEWYSCPVSQQRWWWHKSTRVLILIGSYKEEKVSFNVC